MNCLVEYDDVAERLAMHPKLLPSDDDSGIGVLPMDVAVLKKVVTMKQMTAQSKPAQHCGSVLEGAQNWAVTKVSPLAVRQACILMQMTNRTFRTVPRQ